MEQETEVTIENVFPDYAAASADLRRQYQYLFDLYSMPLNCPACKEPHTYNRVIISKHRCPNTGKPLEHQLGLFGDQQWFIFGEEN